MTVLHPRDRRTDRPLSPLDRLKQAVMQLGGAVQVDTYDFGQRVTVSVDGIVETFDAQWGGEPNAAEQALGYFEDNY